MQKTSAKDAGLNLIVPVELKRRISKTAVAQGKKVSAFVRESIEEKLDRVEREEFEGKMREAYLELAEENLGIVEEFKHSHAENL